MSTKMCERRVTGWAGPAIARFSHSFWNNQRPSAHPVRYPVPPPPPSSREPESSNSVSSEHCLLNAGQQRPLLHVDRQLIVKGRSPIWQAKGEEA